MKIFPQNSRSFPGVQGNYLFSKTLEKISKFQEFFRTIGKLSVFSRSFPGLQGNYLFFQEFSRSIGKLSVFSGVFQEFREIICFSRSFPEPLRKISKFQEFSRNFKRSGTISVSKLIPFIPVSRAYSLHC